MGAYTCEFGVVHKMCRCPTPHTIKCDVPSEHGSPLIDVLGRPVRVGSRVAIAFSYSRPSVGHLRIGKVETIEPEFTVRWEKEFLPSGGRGKELSPPMVYSKTRVIVI